MAMEPLATVASNPPEEGFQEAEQVLASPFLDRRAISATDRSLRPSAMSPPGSPAL